MGLYTGGAIHGYAEEVLDALPEDYFSCLVTSPRYNCGKTYQGISDDTPDSVYLSEMADIFRKARRVMRRDSFLFINIGDNLADPLKSHRVLDAILSLKDEAGNPLYHFRQRFLWAKSVSVEIDHECPSCDQRWSDIQTKGQFTPSTSDYSFAQTYEFVFCISPNPKLKFDRLALGIPFQDKNNVGRYADRDVKAPGDIWVVKYETSAGGNKKPHVAPFPVELPRRAISISPEGPVIDIFGGSGTTLKAARLMGRECWCIEQNADFVQEGFRYHQMPDAVCYGFPGWGFDMAVNEMESRRVAFPLAA